MINKRLCHSQECNTASPVQNCFKENFSRERDRTETGNVIVILEKICKSILFSIFSIVFLFFVQVKFLNLFVIILKLFNIDLII